MEDIHYENRVSSSWLPCNFVAMRRRELKDFWQLERENKKQNLYVCGKHFTKQVEEYGYNVIVNLIDKKK